MKTKILSIAVGFLFLVSCNNAAKENKEVENHEEHEEGIVELTKKQEQALNLKLGKLQKRNLTTVVKINGELSVSPSNSADITAIIGGNIKEIKVFQGDKVTKGQKLIVLEHPDYIALQEDFAVLSHNLEFLRQEYRRQKELYEKNVGSGKEYQKAKAKYNTAKAKYEGLKARLQLLNLSPEKIKQGHISNTVALLSPMDGYVSRVNFKVGTYVNAKDVILEITDISRLHADFKVYEKDVRLLRKGQKIHFTVANNPGKEYTATVFAVGKEFEKNSRTVTIHAKIDGDIDNLIPGMYVTGHLHADEKYTWAVPNEAIVKKGVKYFVFVSDNDKKEGENNKTKDRFILKEVIPGVSDGGFTEVHFTDDMDTNALIVQNVAYYLAAEMDKEETGDHD